MARVVVFSGPIAAGKSTIAFLLQESHGVRVCRTSDLLRTSLGASAARPDLQRAGAELDNRTAGRWVADVLAQFVLEEGIGETDDVVILDSARRQEQIDALREAFGSRLIHVHITAAPDKLAANYRRRNRSDDDADYAAVVADPIEAGVGRLAPEADLVIDRGRMRPEDAAVKVAARLGLFGSHLSRLVDVVVGGEYGSEGKGHIAAYLAPEYQLLVRVGGPNAGHSVITDAGPYVHHQLPSGTRINPAAHLLIGPGATLYVPKLLREIAECDVDADRLSIDPQAMIITEDHRAEEAQIVKGIGGTGQGGGAAAAARVMRVPEPILARGVPELRPYIRRAADVLDQAYARRDRIFLEGTQGTGLSLYHGPYPHVTSRDTTVSGCLAEAGIPPGRVRRVVMVCRTYPIRVQNPAGGTSGYMGTELSWAEISRRSGINVEELRKAERTSTTNRRRRVAEFDWELLHRAASLNRPTDIALTFVDYLSVANRAARRFEQLTSETIKFMEEVEVVAGAPVTLVSTRFHLRSIIDRRAW